MEADYFKRLQECIDEEETDQCGDCATCPNQEIFNEWDFEYAKWVASLQKLLHRIELAPHFAKELSLAEIDALAVLRHWMSTQEKEEANSWHHLLTMKSVSK